MYCSIEDILKEIDKDQLIKLVDDENRGTLVELEDNNDVCNQRINQQIINAREEIDGSIRGRYPLPLSSVPNRVKQLCVDIAIYNLYKRRFRLEMPESIVKIYKDCQEALDRIAKGIEKLDVSEETGSTSFIKINKRDKIFND